MKIVVLAGGLSPERMVSLVSGRSVCGALKTLGHRAVMVDLYLGLNPDVAKTDAVFDMPLPDAAGVSAVAPDLAQVRNSRVFPGFGRIGAGVLDVCAQADLVFLGLHGQDGEDGRIQALLDLMEVPYTGSGYLASAMAMDKGVSKQFMDANNIPTPAWQHLRYDATGIDALVDTLALPTVIKVCNGGSSLGVYLPDTKEELRHALTDALTYNATILAEARIVGREFTVGVLGDVALPPVEMIGRDGKFDYEAKYQAGGAQEICPADLTPAQAETAGAYALALHRAMGLRVYSRTDVMLDADGNFWCLEINSLPGMTEMSLLPKEAAVAGMTYPQLCQKIVDLSLAKEGTPCNP